MLMTWNTWLWSKPERVVITVSADSVTDKVSSNFEINIVSDIDILAARDNNKTMVGVDWTDPYVWARVANERHELFQFNNAVCGKRDRLALQLVLTKLPEDLRRHTSPLKLYCLTNRLRIILCIVF